MYENDAQTGKAGVSAAVQIAKITGRGQKEIGK